MMQAWEMAKVLIEGPILDSRVFHTSFSSTSWKLFQAIILNNLLEN